MITFDELRRDDDVRACIAKADEALRAQGYTEHSFAHVCRVADTAARLLTALGYPERDVELARIAAYLHDIGNLVNRAAHAQSGAILAFKLLSDRGMDLRDAIAVASAIGNHDESAGTPVDPISAALILADKADVRRSRVRNADETAFDIHDRVNYSVRRSALRLDAAHGSVALMLAIDTRCGSVMDYFEIFLNRMALCRRAAERLGLRFQLVVNGHPMI